MTHLDSQVQQFGGFTPGKRVFGLDPEIPIGTAGSPHFSDFMNPKAPRKTKTHRLVGGIRQIRQASAVADFDGKTKFALG